MQSSEPGGRHLARRAIVRDVCIVVGFAVAAYAAAESFGLGRRVWAWLSRHAERSEPADLLIAATALVAGLVLFSTLRWLERRREVAGRRAVEERLREAEQRYRDLVERIPTVTYIEECDTGRFAYVSPQIDRLLGYSSEEFARPGAWRAAVHPDDAQRVDDADRRSDATGEPFDIEYRLRAKDGRDVWVHEHTELIRGDDGRRPFWLGVMADVTERRVAERRSRDAEARYRRLVEQLPAVVYIDAADDVSTALYISPRYEELVGYTPQERLAEPDLWTRMLHPDDRAWVLAESDRTNRTGEPFMCEYRLLRKDGREVWVRDEAHLVEDEDGRRTWQGVLLDITERKAAEQSLERREAILPAVGFAAQRFLKDAAWERSMDEVLAHLGGAVDVSRVAVLERAGDAGSAPRRFEWTAPRAAGPAATAMEDREPERWAALLAGARLVSGPSSSFPAAERAWLAAQGVRSILVAPIIVDGEWWGTVRFDERRSEREWTPLETEAARAAADILGTAIHRRLAERRLADTEAQFRTLVEQLPSVTYIDTTTEPWRTIYVSPQIETVLGYTQEEWMRVPSEWVHVLHPDDRERVLAAVDRHNETGLPYEAEYRLRTKDGRWLWIRDQARMVEDEAGERFSQGVMFDITSRVEAEHHLRDAEERFRVLVEQSPAMLYIEQPDPTKPSVYVSPQVEAIFGLTPEEYIAEPLTWERMLHPDDAAEAKRGYEEALAAGRPWSLEYRVVRPDGRVIWVRDESALSRDERGEVTGVQGVVYDITQRKLAEQTLMESERRERQAADRLRALDDMKNTFLAAVSHELRSPLTSILGLALTLERQEQISDDDREDLLGRLATNARKLDRLLKDLLDIDRLSRGIITPQYRMTDVGALARRTVENLDSLGGRAVSVHTEPVLIPVDPAKVERIVENLVANAARHTTTESQIWVRVAPHEGGALLVVEDDGPGVPQDLRAAIFEPFRQGPDVSKASPGTGIGLSLVARFAELHGGRAWAGDRDGGGASFAVFLPGSPHPTTRDETVSAQSGAA